MAPKKSVSLPVMTPANAAAAAVAAPTPAPTPQPVPVEEIVPADEEYIEEIVPEEAEGDHHQPGFVLDTVFYEGGGEDADDEEDGEDEDEDEDEEEDEAYELVTAVGQLTQLMMTEEGVAIADVLNGIRDALDKQNKIMYRGVQLLEKLAPQLASQKP